MLNYRRLIEVSKKTLSDKEYLQSYINDTYCFMNYEKCGIKDINSIIICFSTEGAKAHGYKNADNSIGDTDYEIPCKVSESADTLRKQDQEAITTRFKKQILDIHEYHTGFAVVKSTKTPIINPSTNNVLGVFWLGRNIEIDITLKNILDIHNVKFGECTSYSIGDIHNKFNITEFEREILFCICLGINSRKDIAYLLSVIYYKKEISASNTVSDAIRRLYRKLDCNTHYQLIEFAVYNNLHLEIPQAFLPTGSYTIR